MAAFFTGDDLAAITTVASRRNSEAAKANAWP